MSPADLPTTGTETREDLARHLMSLGLDKKLSALLVRTIIDAVCDTLGEGEDVGLRGFGRFSVDEKGARPVRNLQTGDPMVLKPRRTVTFRPANVLRSEVTAALCSDAEGSMP